MTENNNNTNLYLTEILNPIKRHIYQDIQEKFHSPEQDDEILKYYYIYKSYLKKRFYKKIIREIKEKDLIKKYVLSNNIWLIIYIKIIAQLKIIENKIFKYDLSQQNNPEILIQISNCNKYISTIQEDYELLSSYDFSINTISKIEKIIYCYVKYIYVVSLFNKKIGKFLESIILLKSILDYYKDKRLYITKSKTIYHIQKCYLLLIQIFLSNHDYKIAFDLLNQCLKISLKQIIYSVNDVDYGVYLGKDVNIKDNYKEKILSNIGIIFLYKGILYDNIDKLKNAILCYKTSNWFINKFLTSNKNNKLTKTGFQIFLIRLKERMLELEKTLKYINITVDDYKNNCIYKVIPVTNKKLRKIAYGNYFNDKKFKGLGKKLLNFKIKEVETANKYEQQKDIEEHGIILNDKNIYLSNVRLLEIYLRSDFSDIIRNMNKIKMFDFDYATRTKIQNTINKIYFEENQKQKQNTKKNSSKSVSKNIIKISKKISYDSRNNSVIIHRLHPKDNNLNNNSLSSLTKKTPCNKTQKIPKLMYNNNYNNNKTNSPLSINNYTSKKNFNYNNKKNNAISQHVFLNKNYLKKRSFIKNMHDRELEFQKKLLRSKNTPRIPQDPSFSEINMEQSANNFYQRINALISSKPVLEEIKFNITAIESKKNLQREKLENLIYKSLDSKALNRYLNEQKKLKNSKSNLNYDENYDDIFYYYDKNNLNNVEYSKEEVENSNRSALQLLNKEINDINNKKNDEVKKIRFIKYRKNDKEKKNKNLLYRNNSAILYDKYKIKV